MRRDQTLMKVLRQLADLLTEEAGKNPEFAAKLNSLLNGESREPAKTRRPPPSMEPQAPLPDIYAEWTVRGESEFVLWLRDQPVRTLRLLIARHDLDAARRTSKWNDSEKLSAYIADQIRSRLARGSSFLRKDDNK